MKKVLFIRFSSIGDIVLTTPLLRCLKDQKPDVEIHYLTKKQFVPVIKANPYIDKIHRLDETGLKPVVEKLKLENFDFIADLHKNFRSLYVRRKLRKPYGTFGKLNLQKWLLVRFGINRLPDIHIVDRYFAALKPLHVSNDSKGLDYFIPEEEEVSRGDLPEQFRNGYIGISIGAKHFTKIFPEEKLIELIGLIKKPVILLGGPEDKERGENIVNNTHHDVFNACGKYSINQSASLTRQADRVISNDTGLMHIAAAFKKEIISLWGNTIPEFGMYPFLPEGQNNKSKIFEVKNLSCRPCSKLGHKKCPKDHFKCMMEIDVEEVARVVNR